MFRVGDVLTTETWHLGFKANLRARWSLFGSSVGGSAIGSSVNSTPQLSIPRLWLRPKTSGHQRRMSSIVCGPLLPPATSINLAP